MGNQKKGNVERSNTRGTSAGLDVECDYAPREQREGKNESGHGRNLEKKVEYRRPMF